MSLNHKRVLVVGTTVDYIEVLASRFPGRCLYLTDPRERAKSAFVSPDIEEILVSLDSSKDVCVFLDRALDARGMTLSGVACYDCESLLLASELARRYALPFASDASVRICRSKSDSKKIWTRCGVPCPPAAAVSREKDVLSFFDAAGGPVVLKPLTGSGSELVFLCRDREACLRDFRYIAQRLDSHQNRRMYAGDGRFQPVIGAEGYAGGEEFSCDFVLEEGVVRIIRLIKKIPFADSSFGSTLAYVVQTDYCEAGGEESLKHVLKAAAHSVGLTRAMAMVDFKVDQGRISLIELTPRPGGDCIPPLIKESCGYDTLGAQLDFSEGRISEPPPISVHKPFVGMHLFARQSGVISHIDAKRIADDPRVILYYLKRAPGDLIRLPPEDYDTRILGYVVFEPLSRDRIEQECLELSSRLILEFNNVLPVQADVKHLARTDF